MHHTSEHQRCMAIARATHTFHSFTFEVHNIPATLRTHIPISHYDFRAAGIRGEMGENQKFSPEITFRMQNAEMDDQRSIHTTHS